MVRAPCCEKMGLKKGPWSSEEDQILTSYIHKFGHGNWRALPKHAGLLRCGKSCRLRWINYLRPDIKRGNFSQEEEETIINLHEMLGNRWSAIAARLPGRTDNEIKNVWHTHLKKKLKNKMALEDSKRRSIISTSKCDTIISENSNLDVYEQLVASSPQCSSEMSTVTDTSIKMVVKNEEIDYSSEYFSRIDENFWSKELMMNDIHLIEQPEDIDQFRFPLSPTQSVEMGRKVDDGLNFWYNLFIRAGDMPDLPNF